MSVLRKIKFLVFLIIPALLWIGYNNVANWHLHQLEFGLLTSHAHAYERSAGNDDPVQDHQHNKRELIFLNQIFQSFLVCLSLFIIASIVRRPFNYLDQKHSETLIYRSPYKLIPVRGPPQSGF